MSHYKSKSNRNSVRLMKQVEESEFEYREYGAPKIRYGSYNWTIYDMEFWDTAPRSNFTRSWKSHRKTQYKQ